MMKKINSIIFLFLLCSVFARAQNASLTLSSNERSKGRFNNSSLSIQSNSSNNLSLTTKRPMTIADLNHKIFLESEAMMPDSMSAPVKRKLIPDNASWMERGLWGENGLMRKTDIAGELTPEQRKEELGWRRTMLTTHQIGGFIALGSMITACYFGQKILDGDPGYRGNHQLAVTASIISYSATGLLAVLAPPPLIRRDEVSTTTIHKMLAWVHFTGMVLTPILGSMIKRRTYDQQAHFHQISAYITTAAMAASMITVTF